MGDFFSDTHVTEAGLQGSAGPSVGTWDMVQQGFRQQYHVDSSLALDQELATRWAQSLQGLRENGQNFSPPTGSLMYRRFVESVRNGTPVLEDNLNPLYTRGGVPQPSAEAAEMSRANEAIRQLNNPHIKTFEQILEEVSAMQHGVEEQTASMSERTGALGSVGEMLGSMAGSFTLRDPLNLATMPVGFGRTIATRIAVDMATAGITTAVTEFADVAPNRALVGLPERNPYYDIAASALGAGLIRGAVFEPVSHILGRFRAAGEDINFDLRDAQLRQMFAEHDASPAARAASSVLDDTIVFERSNPYGEGQVAGYRWQAELDATARALNGEPKARLDLPPIPSEYVDRALSFQSVKETAPELWDKLEVARAKLAQETVPVDLREFDVGNLVYKSPATGEEIDILLHVDEDGTAHIEVNSNDVTDASKLGVVEVRRVKNKLEEMYPQITKFTGERVSGAGAGRTQVVAARRAANAEYQAAYHAVEAEAERLELAEAARRSVAQTQSIDVLGPAVTSEPMTGPLTRFDFVEAHAGKVDAADAAISAKADAVNELEINPETNTVDIGAKTPVSVDFKVPFEEGELSVREILDDLAEDQRLEEAVKGCAV